MGEDINAPSTYYKGMTPLLIAICFGNINAVRMLLRLGADIEKKVPYHWLCRHLSKEGADLHLQLYKPYWILLILHDLYNSRLTFFIRSPEALSGNHVKAHKINTEFQRKTELLKVLLASPQMFRAIKKGIFSREDLQSVAYHFAAYLLLRDDPQSPYQSNQVLVREVDAFYNQKMGSLKELSAKSVHLHNLSYRTSNLPQDVKEFLDTHFATQIETIASSVNEKEIVVRQRS
jgi:hypothetical protein